MSDLRKSDDMKEGKKRNAGLREQFKISARRMPTLIYSMRRFRPTRLRRSTIPHADWIPPTSIPYCNFAMSSPTAQVASRLSRIFTAEYAKRINAQITSPAQAAVVKPNELHSALARPLHLAAYEPDRDTEYLAATLAFGVIKGHPFMDGNKRAGPSCLVVLIFLERLYGMCD